MTTPNVFQSARQNTFHPPEGPTPQGPFAANSGSSPFPFFGYPFYIPTGLTEGAGSGFDNAVPIQAAIDLAAAAASGTHGGTVLLPSGVYDIASTLVFPRNVSVMGMGYLATQLRATAAITMMQLQGTGTEFDCSFSQFFLNMNNLATTAFDFGMKVNNVIDRVRINQGPAGSVGIRINGYNNTVHKTQIANLGTGIMLTNSSNHVVIDDCNIVNAVKGVFIQAAPGIGMSGIFITNNNIEACSSLGIDVDPNGGNIDNVVITGRFEANKQAIDVRNNAFSVNIHDFEMSGMSSTTYHIVLRSGDTRVENGIFYQTASLITAVQLSSTARRTYIGPLSSFGPLTLVENNSTQALTIVDAFNSRMKIGDAIRVGKRLQLAANFDKTDASLSTVTGLSFTAPLAGVYNVRFAGYVTCSAVGGFYIRLGGTATCTSNYDYSMWDDDIPQYANAGTVAFNSAVASNVADTNFFVTIDADINVTVPGTIEISFSQQVVDAVPSRVLAGATLAIQ